MKIQSSLFFYLTSCFTISMNFFTELYQLIETNNLWDTSITLQRNAYLCSAGKKESHMYFITSGSLKIFILDEGEEHIIRFGYQKNFITALDSFISDKPSDFYIQALKKTEVKAITKKDYFELLQKKPEYKELWDTILQQLILQQIEREKDILIRSPHKRYQRVLKRSPQLFQEIPDKHIASYLRMTPETLSRVKNLDLNQD